MEVTYSITISIDTCSNYIEVIKKEITNNFLKNTLTASQNIQEKMTIQPLWNNKKVKIDFKQNQFFTIVGIIRV